MRTIQLVYFVFIISVLSSLTCTSSKKNLYEKHLNSYSEKYLIPETINAQLDVNTDCQRFEQKRHMKPFGVYRGLGTAKILVNEEEALHIAKSNALKNIAEQIRSTVIGETILEKEESSAGKMDTKFKETVNVKTVATLKNVKIIQCIRQKENRCFVLAEVAKKDVRRSINEHDRRIQELSKHYFSEACKAIREGNYTFAINQYFSSHFLANQLYNRKSINYYHKFNEKSYSIIPDAENIIEDILNRTIIKQESSFQKYSNNKNYLGICTYRIFVDNTYKIPLNNLPILLNIYSRPSNNYKVKLESNSEGIIKLKIPRKFSGLNPINIEMYFNTRSIITKNMKYIYNLDKVSSSFNEYLYKLGAKKKLYLEPITVNVYIAYKTEDNLNKLNFNNHYSDNYNFIYNRKANKSSIETILRDRQFDRLPKEQDLVIFGRLALEIRRSRFIDQITIIGSFYGLYIDNRDSRKKSTIELNPFRAYGKNVQSAVSKFKEKFNDKLTNKLTIIE